MTSWIHGSFPDHEVNVVFARGVPLDAVTRGLRDRLREPLAAGQANGWAWAVHDMHNWEAEDYDDVDYGGMCPDGAEIVVFVTEPCSAKGFPPAFEYYRDGRTVLWFSFEDVQQRMGENPDHLSPELLAANLIGPDAGCGRQGDDGHDCFDHHYDDHERLVTVIADHFALPSPSPTGEGEVIWLPPMPRNTFVTFCKGMREQTLSGIFTEAGHPADSSGESSGWAWVTHDAYAAEQGTGAWELARDITGCRYADRADVPDRVETVFLASTPACECPHGQNYMVPHCAEHPFQFAYSHGGFERTYFNIGRRRESRRAGGTADLLVRELLDAGIIGRDTPAYDIDPGFNADGSRTLRIIAAHFGLPSPTA